MSVPRMHAASVEEKFEARTVRVEGGHLTWTGANYLAWKGVLLKPARVAFRIRTGREPVGYVRPDCGLAGCVEPTHVEDQPGRLAIRAALRAIQGMVSRPAECAHDHDQAIHGRFTPDGRAYCNTCLTVTRTRTEVAA